MPRGRVEPGQVEPSELVDDGGRGDVLERKVGTGGERRGREVQGQRVAARYPVDACHFRAGYAESGQQRLRGVGVEVAQGQLDQQLAVGCRPRRIRPLAPGENDAHVLCERRDQRSAQPVVEQPQALDSVEHEHDATAERGKQARGILAGHSWIGQSGAQRGVESPLGRLNVGGVELERCRAERARSAGEGAHERRLAGAGDAMHVRDERLVPLDQREQGVELAVASDERARALVEELSDGRMRSSVHGRSRR